MYKEYAHYDKMDIEMDIEMDNETDDKMAAKMDDKMDEKMDDKMDDKMNDKMDVKKDHEMDHEIDHEMDAKEDFNKDKMDNSRRLYCYLYHLACIVPASVGIFNNQLIMRHPLKQKCQSVIISTYNKKNTYQVSTEGATKTTKRQL